MAKYLSCGNIMSDMVELSDGTQMGFHLGGPAIFGAEGIRLWTDDCAMVCKVGEDYEATYGKWLDCNGLTKEYVNVLPYQTSRCRMKHYADGSYLWEALQGMEHIEKFDLSYEDVKRAVSEDTECIYVYMYPEDDFFNHLHELRQIKNFKMMWEFGGDKVTKWDDSLLKNIDKADMFSCNSLEASKLFGIPRKSDELIIAKLQQLPVEFIFYRVGKRGAYGITADEVWFCPSVDPTGTSVDPSGCGNCSTAAAAYGWVATLDAAKATAMGCISSGYNAAQYGVWDKFTNDTRNEAIKLLSELLKRVTREHIDTK